MKLCWEKEAPIGIMGIWSISYGWDDSFGTGIIRNSVSFAVSIRGYWIGISRQIIDAS